MNQSSVTRALYFLAWLVLRVYAVCRPSARIAQGSITRWFLTSRPTDGHTGPPGCYLHRINRADFRLDEHNHPWTYGRSYVLRGGYAEQRDGVMRARLAGTRSDFAPTMFHRIDTVLPNTWTLFVAGPKTGRGWGFR